MNLFFCSSRGNVIEPENIVLMLSPVLENGKPCMAGRIQTGKRKFRFGAAIPEAAQQYIAAVLNKKCRRI